MAEKLQVSEPLFLDFDLPNHRIAERPAERRDASRLMIVRRNSQKLKHRSFSDLPDYLGSNDLLILNDSRVLPARLTGRRAATGGRWEGLFLQETESGWEFLAKTRGYLREHEKLLVDGSDIPLVFVGRTDDRHWILKPEVESQTVDAYLNSYGSIPLPPYIRKGIADEADRDRYQTIYAQVPGSVAAPTAGLHFTPELIDQLKAKGVSIAKVTLHVGLGTFEPIKSDDPLNHIMHAERYHISEELIAAIATTRTHGGRIIAVGTTATRALETAAQRNWNPKSGMTTHFIYPPYPFQVIQGLITNFHLPRTTLLLLVQALSGSETLRRAYQEAIAREYRFFSYGDAMLVI